MPVVYYCPDSNPYLDVAYLNGDYKIKCKASYSRQSGVDPSTIQLSELQGTEVGSQEVESVVAAIEYQNQLLLAGIIAIVFFSAAIVGRLR